MLRHMTNPTSGWDPVPVFGTWLNIDGSPKVGRVRFTMKERIVRTDGSVIYPAGGVLEVALNAVGGMVALFPANDDPDVLPRGWEIKVEEQFAGGASYNIAPTLAALTNIPPGINLAKVVLPPMVPSPLTAAFIKNTPGGLAGLDKDGDVTNGRGIKVGLQGLTGATGLTGSVGSIGPIGPVGPAGPAGTGAATTDASALTSGILAPARIGDASLLLVKLSTALQASVAKADTAIQGTDARLTDARTPVAHSQGIATITGLQAVLDAKVATPAGGTDGQALVKSGTTVAFATIAGGGTATTDASALTSGILAPARIGDASLLLAKLSTALQASVAKADTAIQGTDARLTDARTPVAHTQAVSTITNLQTALDAKVATPAGGTDGQALVKAGTTVAFAAIAPPTTDASALTTGTLPPARVGDGSVAAAKLTTTAQASLTKADASVTSMSGPIRLWARTAAQSFPTLAESVEGDYALVDNA